MVSLFNKKLLCGMTVSSSWEQESEYKNQIILSSSKDRVGVPRIKLKYNISKKTLETAKEMINQIGLYFIKEDLGRIAGDQAIYDIKNFISDAGYHHIGGTIMGENKNNSVVDKNLKVHDINNLYICGSSIFPSSGHANPTLSIIQFSLRLADHLIGGDNTI